MNIQQTGLFGEIAVPAPERQESRLAERRRKAKLAYDSTSEVWKRWTYKLSVEEFLPLNAVFLFEELSGYYNEKATERGLPATINGKAFAGLQRRLISEGKIELIQGETRVRSNGQEGKIYKSKLFLEAS